MPRLTRRRLFAAGGAGAAATALAACGASEEESERSAEGDAALLRDAYTAEMDLQRTYDDGGLSELSPIGPTSKAVREAQAERMDVLGRLGASLSENGSGTIRHPDPPRNAIEDASTVIRAYREAAALLSTTEARLAIFELIPSIAAELALLRSALGEEPSPFAFVTGGTEEPYEDSAFDPTPDE